MSLDFDFVLIYWPFYIGEILDEHHRQLEFSNKFQPLTRLLNLYRIFIKHYYDDDVIWIFILALFRGHRSADW